MKQTLGAFIAQLRKEKNLTQRQLAEMLSVSDKTVSHWEREESSPDISLLPLLADIFEITVDELLRGERKEQTKEEKAFEKTAGPVLSEESKRKLHYIIEKEYGKFGMRNLISMAMTVIASLSDLIFYNHAYITTGFIVFMILITVSLTLTFIFRIAFSTSHPDIERDVEDKFRLNANRITSLNVYFALAVTAVAAYYFVSFNFAVGGEFTALIFAAGVLISEILLRKTGAVRNSVNSKNQKKLFLLRLCSALMAVFLMFFGVTLQRSFRPEIVVYEKAEYELFTDPDEFVEYMQTPKEKPSRVYSDAYSERTLSFSIENEKWGCSTAFWHDTDYESEKMIEFIWNNEEVAEFISYIGEIKVYTHDQLLTSQEQTRGYIRAVQVLLVLYYPAVLIALFGLYKLIKKKMKL